MLSIFSSNSKHKEIYGSDSNIITEIYNISQHKIWESFGYHIEHPNHECSYCFERYRSSGKVLKYIPLAYNKYVPDRIERCSFTIQFTNIKDDTKFNINHINNVFKKDFKCKLNRCFSPTFSKDNIELTKDSLSTELSTVLKSALINSRLIIYLCGSTNKHGKEYGFKLGNKFLSVGEFMNYLTIIDNYMTVWMIVDIEDKDLSNLFKQYLPYIYDGKFKRNNTHKSYIYDMYIISRNNSNVMLWTTLHDLIREKRGRFNISTLLKTFKNKINIWSTHKFNPSITFFGF